MCPREQLWPLSQALQQTAAIRSASAIQMCRYENLSQEHPSLQQKGSDWDQSLPKVLLVKGQAGFGRWSGQLSWHSGVVTASPANLWLFQLSDIYPVLPLEDKGTVSSLQYTHTVQRKRAMVGICFSSDRASSTESLKFILISVLSGGEDAVTSTSRELGT